MQDHLIIYVARQIIKVKGQKKLKSLFMTNMSSIKNLLSIFNPPLLNELTLKSIGVCLMV